jgi:hypothetical protein
MSFSWLVSDGFLTQIPGIGNINAAQCWTLHLQYDISSMFCRQPEPLFHRTGSQYYYVPGFAQFPFQRRWRSIRNASQSPLLRVFG